MKNIINIFKDLRKNSQFSTRVLILSIPCAFLFCFLSYFRFLPISMSILCYVFILIFNMVSLFPISYELETLRKYIYSLANDDATNSENLKLAESDAQRIAEAINSMHRFWSAKTDSLTAQKTSDAAVLDTLPDPILMIDNEGNITGCNLAAKTMLGNNILSLNIDTLFSTNIFIAAVDKVLKNKSTSERLVFHAAEYNNRQIYAHITKLPNESPARSTAVISLYDISKALSLEKMQSDFVANASHELRTPLSVISGFIDTLQTSARDDPDAQEAFLKIMREQADYMSSLIEDLLSLSRLEMGQNKELKDKVDIKEVIDDVIQALKIKAFTRSLDIKIIEPSRLPKIIGDNQQIHQVLQNILDNAIKYAPEKSTITLEVKIIPQIPPVKGLNIASGRAVSLSVNNKGPKIEKSDLSRLTEKFYRMQIHKDMKIKGTGLGLSIAKQIVLHHHGNLTATSTAYNGTTFTIYLPVKQA